MPGPFELTTFGDGTPKRVDWKTRAALEEAQALLGYPLTVVQGSYHQGVSASAGTHDGGGVVDLLAWDWQRKVKALRKVGFAAWYRPPVARPLGPAHPRRPDRPRQARAGRRPAGDRLPQRARRPEEQPARPVLAAEPDPRLPLPAGAAGGAGPPGPGNAAGDGADGGRLPAEADPRRGRHQPPPGRSDRPQGGPGGRTALVVRQGDRGRLRDGRDVQEARQAGPRRRDPGRRVPLRPPRPRRRREGGPVLPRPRRHPGRRHAADARPGVAGGDVAGRGDRPGPAGGCTPSRSSSGGAGWWRSRSSTRRSAWAAASAACCGWPATATTSGRR